MTMALPQARLPGAPGMTGLMQTGPFSAGAGTPDSGQPGHEVILLLGQRAEAAVRLAYHLTRDREAALDLSQEAFVKALEALPQLKDRAQAGVWFNRIVVNLCRDWIRHRGAERRATDAVSLQPVGSAPDPALQAERSEAAEQLRAALLQLPLELREAMALVCVEGHEPKDAAEILGCADGTLRWRLHEGRKLLKQILE